MNNIQNKVLIIDSQELHNTIKDIFYQITNNDKNVISKEPNQNLVSTLELSKALKVSPLTITRWRKKNRIPFIKIGKSYRYDYDLVIKELGKKKGGNI